MVSLVQDKVTFWLRLWPSRRGAAMDRSLRGGSPIREARRGLLRGRRRLGLNQAGQIERRNFSIERVDDNGVGFDIVPNANPRDFRKKIDLTQIGQEREHRRVVQRRLIPDERQFSANTLGSRMEGASAAERRFRFDVLRE